MRKLILLLLFVFGMNTLSAQFDVKSGSKTSQTITIENKTYPVYTTKKGSPYVILHSLKTNHDYPLWIGKATNEKYEGHSLRQSKSGKYFYFKISENSGNPYCKFIKSKVKNGK